jgi:hypothetical protein
LREFIGGDVDVKKIKFLTGRGGAFNGLCIAQFTSAKDADDFMKKNGETFKGNEIKLFYAHENRPGAYVKGYPEGFTEEQMRQFVGAKKSVSAIRFVKDGEVCFVDFKTIIACNRFLQKNDTTVEGETVTVRLADGVDRSKTASVFVGNLPDMRAKGTGTKLRAFLEKFGTIKRLKIVSANSIAFVSFSSGEEAAKCKASNGSEFLGKPLVLTTKGSSRTGGPTGPRRQRKQSAGSL